MHVQHSCLTTRQPIVKFYLLAVSRFLLWKNTTDKIKLTASTLAGVQVTYK